jgi:aminoglycoside 6'-N-acetyltransferase
MGSDETPVYGFRPVSSDDLPVLAAWLEEPHVARWWDDSDDKVSEIREAMIDPATEPFVATLNGRPIGYIQSYDPHAEDGHPYQDQPRGTFGIDQFIGEPDLVGLGHGPRLIAAFVDRLFQRGALRVITDPDPTNDRAIRAYAKAGFRPLDTRTTVYGPALIMACDPPTRKNEE